MRPSSRTLMGLVIAILTILTAQGWTGDFVNLFAVFPSGLVGRTLGGFTQALINAGRMELTHAILGSVLVALAIAILVAAFHFESNRGVRICAVLGFLAVLSAAYGGISFVLSGISEQWQLCPNGREFYRFPRILFSCALFQ